MRGFRKPLSCCLNASPSPMKRWLTYTSLSQRLKKFARDEEKFNLLFFWGDPSLSVFEGKFVARKAVEFVCPKNRI